MSLKMRRMSLISAASSVFEVFPIKPEVPDGCANRSGLELFCPQSGRVVRCPFAGLCHTRCDPLPRRGTISHPSDASFRAASRYLLSSTYKATFTATSNGCFRA